MLSDESELVSEGGDPKRHSRIRLVGPRDMGLKAPTRRPRCCMDPVCSRAPPKMVPAFEQMAQRALDKDNSALQKQSLLSLGHVIQLPYLRQKLRLPSIAGVPHVDNLVVIG